MEQTLNSNVPRMKERMETELGANIRLSDTVAVLEKTLKKTTHQLEEADRDLKLREAEIQKLRQAVSIKPPSAGAMFTLNRGRNEGGFKPLAGEKPVDLKALDLVEGEKAAVALQKMHHENQQLRGIIALNKAKLSKARAFETKEVPALRRELRQLGADLLRMADVPAMEQKAVRKDMKPRSVVDKKGVNPDIARVKRSLADRLKTVSKLGGEVDA